MTSPSRRNRRITAWSTAIATSLLAASAQAQVARPGMDQPAPTSWQPFTPTTIPNVSSPAPAPVVVPNLPVLPTPVAPPRMMTYEKPAESMQPMPTRRTVATPTTRQRQTVPLPPLPAGIADRPRQAAPVAAQPAVMVRPQAAQPMPTPQNPTPEKPVNPPVPMSRMRGELPDKQDLFRLDSDKELNARILKELREAKSSVRVPGAPDGVFPNYGPLSPPGEKYSPKTLTYEPRQLLLEPNYVIHRRQYFEEMNAERAGWDTGPSQAVFSSLYFYRDVLLFPSKIGSGVHDCYDSSAGKCMPGAPTPYYYYPPGITTFGGVVGATVITGAALIVP